jgi:GT2 family glycosyltransferase
VLGLRPGASGTANPAFMMKSQRKVKSGAGAPANSNGRVSALQRALRRQDERVALLESTLNRTLDQLDVVGSSLKHIEEALKGRTSVRGEQPALDRVVPRIHEDACRHIPRGSIVAVVSKGDPALIQLTGRTGWHFPRQGDGTYSGYYPECDLSAIAHLEALRAKGAQYLLFPESGAWWLDYYPGFRRHLDRSYRLLARGDDTCIIYSLGESVAADRENLPGRVGSLISEFQARFGREPAILDCHTGVALGDMLPHVAIFQPPTSDDSLPYLDRSVDIVVTTPSQGAKAAEARRVARVAVVTIAGTEDGGGLPLEVEWLDDCGTAEPRSTTVSIIICCNGLEFTDACVGSLFETLPAGFDAEIILVDDATTDGTAERLKRWKAKDRRVKVVRNRQSGGFAKACHLGARATRSEILIFLSNRTVLLPGWLPPLFRIFREFPDAGAVGGKLLRPDGAIDEAGGAVFRQGLPTGIGHGETNLEAFVYNFVREVDYCSDGLLATRRSLWEQLGGFDTTQLPGYEDVDYCLRLRKGGHSVYYQPESAAVLCSSDTSSGRNGRMASGEQAGRERFLQLWQREMESRPELPANMDEPAWRALASFTPAPLEGQAI